MKVKEMKKFNKSLNIFFTSALICSALLFNSCASNSGMTDFLASAGEISETLGMDETAAVFNAGSKISKAAEDITPEQEYYIGRAVAATISSNYKVIKDTKREDYLNKICSAIIINSDDPYKFNGYHIKIIDSSEVNAFSTSGGHIFITEGMLACTQSEDDLAAVIAHEIAHIQLKHSIKAIKTSRWKDAGLSAAEASATIAFGANDTELGQTLSEMVGDTISKMVNTGYSKNQEYEADKYAIILMNESGYNVNYMIKMLESMSQNELKKSGMFKTHPSPKKRIKKVNKQLKKLNKKGLIVSDTSSSRVARFKSIMGK